MDSNLFRKEVIEKKKTRWTGNIILSRPFSFTFLVACAALIAVIIVTFIIWGSYTKRSTVLGQLIPESGVIQVYTTHPGIVIKKNVYEGQLVKKGDVLFIISTSSYSEQGDIGAALSKQTVLKAQSLRNEIMHMRQLHKNERETITNQINLLKENLVRTNNLILNQKNRIELAKINQHRYETAFKQNAVSNEELEEKKNFVLDQMTQYESLQNEKTIIEKQLNVQKIELDSLKNKQGNEIEQLERLLSTNTQELIEVQSKQSISIQAPTSGVVSTVNAEIGQFIDFTKPLITILPENSLLIAQLYVPSKAIGFVKKEDQVLLRYKAYPYQKFGHAKAKVISVARTASASQDIKSIGIISPQEQLNNEPVYLVRVQLEQQTVKAYGHDMPLQVGMTLEADIMHETRKLYEWVLEPLFSITGKI
jgi:membrane fusion protein